MKKILFAFLFVPSFVFAQKKEKTNNLTKPIELKNGNDSFSYAIGIDILIN